MTLLDVMKNKFVFATLIASITTLPATANAFTTTTLSAYESPYPATISLRDAGRTVLGKRVIAYRIVTNSSICPATFEGKAEFIAKFDDREDDSAFLRNGDVVKTNIFKGTVPNASITITMDVESSRPKYADILIERSSGVGDGCFRNGKLGLLFF
ncbi:hypothetical protein [Paraburkholderia atlantica]|uniref:hypothetical protein n=1 Tax=Paraburkholderia atlantica TaxID=2654982 RepID=UPI003D24D4B4